MTSEVGSYEINVQEDSGDSNIYYVGKAASGSATSDPVWQIRRVNCTTGTILTWAENTDKNEHIFDNRESLSY